MKVYYECDNDGALLDIFSIPKKEKEHSHSKGNVCKKVSKNIYSCGLVDEDPKTPQPKYISNLGNPVHFKHNIKIFTDVANNNKIIMLLPRLEEWLYSTAKINNIKPSDFGLPSNPDDLHKEEFRKVKTKLNEFLAELLNTPELQFLKLHL